MTSRARELAQVPSVPSGRRNLIINGAMQVAQRSTSVTGIGASSGYFTVDRFKIDVGSTAGRLTMTQTSDGPSGFANCIKLDCTTADTSVAAGEFLVLATRFEGQDLQRFMKGTSDAKEYTVSFYVKGNASATYVCELADRDNSRGVSKTFAVTTGWTRVEITFPADTTGAFDDDNANSLDLQIWLHAGSTYNSGTLQQTWAAFTSANRAVGGSSFFDSTDRTFFITGVQLEVGSVATEFEHRSFGEELALCQRYLFRIDRISGVNTAAHNGAWYSSDSFYGVIHFPVKMRGQPTFTSGSVTNGYIVYGAGAGYYPDSVGGVQAYGLDATAIYYSDDLSGTAGQAGWVQLQENSAFLQFDAEL